ncbi:uncharacterized protein EI90DRAFT_3056212 [Cantharellus anzutake]|uniref:uncharacterized protein n=1 Tax=Cantharellus anzutake TaxID=1750568 RepID=UPI00190645B5|nr:uncharacterized protein EI90DRAFT_3056212 [Cantharellus anzutake]KAF8331999.1 hypothetical protein EI90DRAFT_3056212 [Cantharellus anzutake]
MRTPPSLTTLPTELQRLICETVPDRPTLRALNITNRHFHNVTEAIIWKHITIPLPLRTSPDPPPHRSIGGHVRSICITVGYGEDHREEEHRSLGTMQEAKRLIEGIRLCPKLRRLEFFPGGEESETARILFREFERSMTAGELDFGKLEECAFHGINRGLAGFIDQITKRDPSPASKCALRSIEMITQDDPDLRLDPYEPSPESDWSELQSIHMPHMDSITPFLRLTLLKDGAVSKVRKITTSIMARSNHFSEFLRAAMIQDPKGGERVETFRMLSLDSKSLWISELIDVLAGLNSLFPAISTLGIGRWGTNSEPVWPIDWDCGEEGRDAMIAEGFDWPDNEASLWMLTERACLSLGEFKGLGTVICSYSWVPAMVKRSGPGRLSLEERRREELAAVMMLAKHCTSLCDIFIDRRGWHYWKRSHHVHWTKEMGSRSSDGADLWKEVRWYSQEHLTGYINSL